MDNRGLLNFLHAVGLSWPQKTIATRFQLLDSMVKASLDLGIPILWAFYVGRHPARSSQNTLYLSLSYAVPQWLAQMNVLMRNRKADVYFRRCAEIIGGTGQSYSRMIDDVLAVHKLLLKMVSTHRSALNLPVYMNLSDPEMRRAINGHLPDDSQLWPEDEIVNLQNAFFVEFDRVFLKEASVRSRLKLFLGAFAVWHLAPFTSTYLTSAMLEDMQRAHLARAYITYRCLESLNSVMPLVIWQKITELMEFPKLPYDALRVVGEAFMRYGKAYGKRQEEALIEETARLKVNAFNQTLASELLDETYAALPVVISRDYFTMLLETSEASVATLKMSLKRPRTHFYHIPEISDVGIYRLLVSRELVVFGHLMASPLTRRGHPIQVQAAILGTHMITSIIMLVDVIFFHDERFQVSGAAMTLRESVNLVEFAIA